jgi:hypothetical protein
VDNLRFYVDPPLINYYRDFCRDVRAKQREAIAKEQQEAVATVDGASGVDAAEETDVGAMTLDDIDSAKVAEINQRVMKALKEPDSTHEGESIDFVQAGEHVLLGDKHDPRYYKLLSQQTNHCQGKLTMAEKGGAFSTGKIEVVGSNDEDQFKSAIRDFSKKKITFA